MCSKPDLPNKTWVVDLSILDELYTGLITEIICSYPTPQEAGAFILEAAVYVKKEATDDRIVDMVELYHQSKILRDEYGLDKYDDYIHEFSSILKLHEVCSFPSPSEVRFLLPNTVDAESLEEHLNSLDKKSLSEFVYNVVLCYSKLTGDIRYFNAATKEYLRELARLWETGTEQNLVDEEIDACLRMSHLPKWNHVTETTAEDVAHALRYILSKKNE